MNDTPSVLWRRIDRPGMDRCELGSSTDGYRLGGTALLVEAGRPVEIRYSVALDDAWKTRIVGVHVRSAGDNRSVALRTDGAGNWEAGGRPVPDLDGAIDVDLAWTPATNTLPIRRLDLEVGETARIAVALVPFPERVVETRLQAYTRIAPRRYLYESGDLSTELTVDGDGLVLEYPDVWTAAAPVP